MEIATRLLRELADALGTDELTLNSDGLVGLTFDDLDVFLYWMEDERAFLFCSPLALPEGLETPEARLTFYSALLWRNHLMVGASHAAIGMTADGATLTLSACRPVTEHDDATAMGEALLRFVEDARTLAGELAQWNDQAAIEGEEPTVDPLDVNLKFV